MMPVNPNGSDRRAGRVSAVLRGLWLAVVVTVGLPALVSAFARPPAFGREADGLAVAARDEAITARERDERFAESAAATARLRARFRETLDFAPLMDEFFVSDVGRRNASVKANTGFLELFGATDELAQSLDEEDLRRGYVAFLNFMFLYEASVLATAQPEADDEDDDDIPPSVASEMLASPHFRNLMMDGDAEPPTLKTRDDYMRAVEDAEAIAAAFRRVVTPATFDDPTYLANCAELDTKEHVLVTRSDADSGFLEFGVPEGDTVYEVYRFGVWYDFVEENGTLKVLTIAVSDE